MAQPDVTPGYGGVDLLQPLEPDRFSGRRVLVTGATGASGKTLAHLLLAHGAQVIGGSTKQEKFDAFQTGCANPELVIPFVADLRDSALVHSQITQLQTAGQLPTDIVHAAAGGLQPFMKDLKRALIQIMRETDLPKRAQIITEFKNRLATELVPASLAFAENVNVTAPIAMFEALDAAGALPRGTKVGLYQSFWGSEYGNPNVHIPEFYRGVALTKHQLEEWMVQNTPQWRARGIYPYIISGDILTGTAIGDMAEHIIPFFDLPIDIAALPTTDDMAHANTAVLASDPTMWPANEPLRLYVVGKGPENTLPYIPADHHIFNTQFPL